MNRREILKYTTLLTGSAICTPLLSSILTGCTTKTVENGTGYTAQFFTKKDFDLVKKLVDVILPETDSPSASEVGVHIQIDTFIKEIYTKEYQESFMKEFSALEKFLTEKDFQGSNEEKQNQILQQLELSSEPVKQAFLQLKQQTIIFYLSTEQIAKNYLNYLPVPGEYQSCISLEEVGGKAWAI